MSASAAGHITAQLQRKPDSLLILATGASPAQTYALLAQQGRAEPALCRGMRILKLDEWGGLAMDDPATCEMALRSALVQPLEIGSDRFLGWKSDPADVAEECARIRRLLDEIGPADLCVLGLGLNGHLGFNEPGDTAQPEPHRAELSPESQQHSMLSQARRQPAFGLTLGMRDILRSREVLLLVSGAKKRAQLTRLLTPEITPQFPASFLWLHPALTIYCDEAALPVLGVSPR
jgi:galactosamine-6-phosphate isomerase